MDLMQLGLKPDPDMEPKRTKTLVISVCIHVLLLSLFILDPSIFDTAPKRIIRIAGQDFDLSNTQVTELTMPPPPRPHSLPPLVQPPPQPKSETPPPQPPPQAQQAPPPPPPPPPPKEMPAISPEDILKEGARPDGKVQASRGSTPELRNGGGSDQPKPVPKPDPPQVAQNLNPNGLGLPNLRDQAEKVLNQTISQDRRPGSGPGQGPGQGRTGNMNAPEEPNFASDSVEVLSDTRGYDFGPYLNGVVNKVRLNWYPLIPDIARYGAKGRVTIVFTITKNGTIKDIQTVVNSGRDPFDRAALGSINLSNPFGQLPSNFEGDHLKLQFTFLYNLKP